MSEEEVDDTGRFCKQSDSEKLASPSPLCSIYKAFDRDEAVEVAWVEYSDPAPNLEKFEALREVILKLDHANVMKYKHAWVDQEHKKVVFITEWTTSGNLWQFLQKTKPPLKVFKRWCKQILAGLEFLHGLKPPFWHLDLRIENCYVRGNVGLVKVGGLESFTMRRKVASATTGTLSLAAYLAPECLDGGATSDRADIYAFGVTVLVMMIRGNPYGEMTAAAIYESKGRNELPPGLDKITDPQLKAFITRCLLPERDRPSAHQLLADEFLADVVVPSAPTAGAAAAVPTARLVAPSHGPALSSAPPAAGEREARPVPPSQGVGAAAAPAHPAPAGGADFVDVSLKAYYRPEGVAGAPEVVRIDLDSVRSVDELLQVLREEFELDEHAPLRVRYLDRDNEMLKVTPRTTMAQIRRYALSLHVSVSPKPLRHTAYASASAVPHGVSPAVPPAALHPAPAAAPVPAPAAAASTPTASPALTATHAPPVILPAASTPLPVTGPMLPHGAVPVAAVPIPAAAATGAGAGLAAVYGHPAVVIAPPHAAVPVPPPGAPVHPGALAAAAPPPMVLPPAVASAATAYHAAAGPAAVHPAPLAHAPPGSAAAPAAAPAAAAAAPAPAPAAAPSAPVPAAAAASVQVPAPVPAPPPPPATAPAPAAAPQPPHQPLSAAAPAAGQGTAAAPSLTNAGSQPPSPLPPQPKEVLEGSPVATSSPPTS